VKEEESTLEDELVWVCPWMDSKYATRCGILLSTIRNIHTVQHLPNSLPHPMHHSVKYMPLNLQDISS
jgi:hypothetical protein